MEENVIVSNSEEVAVEQEQAQTYEPKGLAKGLNKFFKFKERGSTMKREVVAGISVFLISVCVLLMNTRIICETLGSDRAGYAGTYLAATIVSFVGTMLLGFVCNLPLVQVSSLGLSTAFVSLLGAQNGLTYYNLLAVSFVGAIVYVVVMAIPASRKFVLAALPEPVRKALPVGTGLYMISYALKTCGVITVGSNGAVSVVDWSSLSALATVALVAATIGVIVVIVCKRFNLAHPYMYGFLTGLLLFYLLGVVAAFNALFCVDRAYLAAGAENLYTFGFGLTGIEWGAVFTKGFDFSAYNGSVATLFIGGALTYLFMGMYESESAVGAVELSDVDCSLGRGKALLVNAAVNVFAPVVGSAPVSIGKQSSVAAEEGAKTGLASVVCGIGYALASLTWAFFALFATYTAKVSEYGHVTSNSFAEYAQAGFVVSGMLMLVVGLFMLRGVKNCNCNDITEFVPFVATAALVAFTQNVVVGVAIGMISYAVLKLLTFKKQEIKNIGFPTAIASLLLLVTLILM